MGFSQKQYLNANLNVENKNFRLERGAAGADFCFFDPAGGRAQSNGQSGAPGCPGISQGGLANVKGRKHI